MNFDLEEQLKELVKTDKIQEAIQKAEAMLQKIPNTDFHKIVG